MIQMIDHNYGDDECHWLLNETQRPLKSLYSKV